MRSGMLRPAVLGGAFVAAGLLLFACGAARVRGTEPDAGGGSIGADSGAAGAAPVDVSIIQLPDVGPPGPPVDAPSACVNLQCQQPTCAGTASTSVSGTVYAPNGQLPLYNVAVYVPNAPLGPLAPGMSCDRCGTLASGRPIASALSDHEGKFRMTNVPAGKDIPLVIQVGKWRRKVVIPEVKPCQDNPLSDPQLTRLPRNRTEGDLPRVALTSGRCDQLTCMIPKLGLDPAEMGVSGQDRAFTFFSGADGDTSGGPPGMMPATALWNDFDELSKYNMVLFSCPCTEARAARGPAALEAVTRYANAGGRVFGSHFEYVWLKYSPDAPLAASFTINAGDLGAPPVVVDTSFPKGKALADWMKFLDPALQYGRIPSAAILDDISSARPPAQVWARSPGFGTASGMSPRFVTINTPAAAPAAQQCGRVALLDVHVTADGGTPAPPSRNPPPFPMACGAELTKSEHALAFLLFDLAACIQVDTTPPLPPPVVVD
jgi:hypothetical protein